MWWKAPLYILVFTSIVNAQINSELRTFTGLPGSQWNRGLFEPRGMTIRSNLPGRIQFLESKGEFIIKLNLSVSEGRNISEIQTVYEMDKDNHSIILQVFRPEDPILNPPKDHLLLIISTTVSGFVSLCFLVTMTIYCCWWKKRSKLSRDTTETDEQPEEKEKKLPSTFSQKRRMYQSGSNPSLHITIIVVIATICIVHAQKRAKVDIMVDVPNGFLTPNVRVFVSEENKNTIEAWNMSSWQVQVYDVENANTVQDNKCLQTNNTCTNGACDPITGDCICPRDRKPVQSEDATTICIYKCSRSCPEGSFETSPCNATHEVSCRKCRAPCSFTEFESTACAGQTDRNCTDISQLPEIKVLPHMIYEDFSKVAHDVTASQLITNISDQYTIWLNRSSGIALKALVTHADFTTKFRQVLYDDNDNFNFPSTNQLSFLKRRFCDSPIPDFYKITLKKYQDLDVLKKDYNRACPNYVSPPTIKPTRRGLYCAGVNNSLVGLFGSRNSSNIFWKAEKSKACFDRKDRCAKCRQKCSNNFNRYPNCNVTQDDVDVENKQKYGEHFSYCFDCCFQTCTCPSCECTRYKNECVRKQLSCIRATQFQLLLKPQFSSTKKFKSHVEMFRGPEVVIETSLWRFGKRVYSVNSVDHNLTEEDDGRNEHDFGFMLVKHPTVLKSMTGKTILINGNTNENEFKVGSFYHEEDITNSIATGSARNEIHVQPIVPFGVNSKAWSHRNCNSEPSFAVLRDNQIHQNFRPFKNLTAILVKQNNESIYKVFDNKESHRIIFDLYRNRSVFRNMFPKTAIINDDSLTGVLLRNRTFWTLQYSGRLNECPGAFNVRMYDQDMPSIEVYNFDIAVTNLSCYFEMEFHLPSGGDTNLIDKQFLTKFTDSYKTVEIILVSPRYKPDFELPIIINKPNFDRLLRVLMPAIYALGTAFVLLLALLIYGYKTKPKDNLQRDRDSKLHFRHILFVVWFVGMRLIKSFLLTLTIFSIVFSAIHYHNVSTLKRYPTFREQRQEIEDELIGRMDKHKVGELNRQLAHLNAGKKLCEEKLREVDELIEAYYLEIRRRLFQEMKIKSIINAAYEKISRKAKDAKGKFEMKRQEINRQIKALTNDINNIIQNVRNKVEKSFWLIAAKIIYKIINFFASIFGKGLGPFIRWVGLDVRFSTLDFRLESFDSFFDEFLARFQPQYDIHLNFNVSKIRLPTTDFDWNIKELRLPSLNISSPFTYARAQELFALDWVAAFMRRGVLAGILLVLDIMWFVFRHCRTYQQAVVLIHGFPVVYDLDDIKKNDEKVLNADNDEKMDEQNSNENSLATQKAPGEEIVPLREADAPRNNKEIKMTSEESDGEIKEDNTKNTTKASTCLMLTLDYMNTAAFFVFGLLKRLNKEITNTSTVPMVLLFVVGLLFIYIIIATAKYALTVETLDTIGYFDIRMSPILVNRKIVNTRITSSAFSINQIQLPYCQNRVNARIMFAKKKAAILKGLQCTTADNHNTEYCFWVDGVCDGVKSYTEHFLKNLTKLECHVPPVIPQRFTKFDRILYKEEFKKGINPFVSAARGLVLNTFYTILVIIGVFLVSKLLEEVIFFVLRRFDLIRTVKSYSLQTEIQHQIPDEEKLPKRKSIKKIGRVKVPDAFSERSSVRVRAGWHLEYKPDEAKKLKKIKEKKDKIKQKNKCCEEEKTLKKATKTEA